MGASTANRLTATTMITWMAVARKKKIRNYYDMTSFGEIIITWTLADLAKTEELHDYFISKGVEHKQGCDICLKRSLSYVQN